MVKGHYKPSKHPKCPRIQRYEEKKVELYQEIKKKSSSSGHYLDLFDAFYIISSIKSMVVIVYITIDRRNPSNYASWNIHTPK